MAEQEQLGVCASRLWRSDAVHRAGLSLLPGLCVHPHPHSAPGKEEHGAARGALFGVYDCEQTDQKMRVSAVEGEWSKKLILGW